MRFLEVENTWNDLTGFWKLYGEEANADNLGPCFKLPEALKHGCVDLDEDNKSKKRIKDDDSEEAPLSKLEKEILNIILHPCDQEAILYPEKSSDTKSCPIYQSDDVYRFDLPATAQRYFAYYMLSLFSKAKGNKKLKLDCNAYLNPVTPEPYYGSSPGDARIVTIYNNPGYNALMYAGATADCNNLQNETLENEFLRHKTAIENFINQEPMVPWESIYSNNPRYAFESFKYYKDKFFPSSESNKESEYEGEKITWRWLLHSLSETDADGPVGKGVSKKERQDALDEGGGLLHFDLFPYQSESKDDPLMTAVNSQNQKGMWLPSQEQCLKMLLALLLDKEPRLLIFRDPTKLEPVRNWMIDSVKREGNGFVKREGNGAAYYKKQIDLAFENRGFHIANPQHGLSRKNIVRSLYSLGLDNPLALTDHLT